VLKFDLKVSGCRFNAMLCFAVCSKIIELEEELKVVGNNMKSLELSEQEVRLQHYFFSAGTNVRSP